MIQIRHHIRGRVRFRIKKTLENRKLLRQLEASLKKEKGVYATRINPGCAAIIIRYNPAIFDLSLLKDRIDHFLSQNPGSKLDTLNIKTVTAQNGCQSCGKEVVSTSHPRRWWLWKTGEFIALAGYWGYLLYREYIKKKPVSQGPTSILAIVSLAAGFPLFKKAWLDTTKEKRFTIHQFLSFSLFLGIIMGEAEAAFEIIHILRGGMLLEDYVAEKSKNAVRKMLQISAKKAFILSNGIELEVPVEELRAGDTVVVRTGEKIPIDGLTTQGEALINESTITGKSEPVLKVKESSVFAGTYVEKGVLYIKAEKVGEATYLARIIAMVEASLGQKAPPAKTADELADRLLKLGTGLTALTFILTGSYSRAFTVMLVMSCPCSTILAASTAVSAAVSNGTKGILIKGGVYLEQIGKADTYCFDKTGTITTEEPIVAEVYAKDEKALFYWASSAELHNSHALATAIHQRAEKLGVQTDQHILSEHVLGFGIKAKVKESEVIVGNEKMMKLEKISLKAYQGKAKEMIQAGRTAIFVAKDGKLLGVIGIIHQVRPGTLQVLQTLKNSGVQKIYLISGDEAEVATPLANEYKMDGCFAGLLPEEKSQIVKKLQEEGKKVVMVGDGVNDALALTEAGIAVAMGAGGSETAIEVADIALVDSRMESLITMRELSNQTVKIVNQNYYLGVGTNLAGVLLGAMGILTPSMGGWIHIGHTLGIMANSSRILFFKDK